MEESNTKCKFCGNIASDSACIKYSYLPLKDKILRWCCDKDFCEKMTSHWEEKEHWLGVEGGHSVKKEIWDGSRFGELSWFWNPDCKC